MVQSQFSLTWDSYKSSICSGFSALQQNGEFVDMTLAADGHFVKVHQVLMALASPYLKELISSAPCQHPVIFLNNVPHRTLNLLLEYIYTGEVLISSDSLTSFIETAKALHIKGLENLGTNDNVNIKMAMKTSHIEDTDMCHVSGVKRLAVPTKQGVGEISLPAAARKIFIKQDNASSNSFPTLKLPIEENTKDETRDYSDMIDDNVAHDSDDGCTDNNQQSANVKNTLLSSSSNLQFTISIRGSLQIILNRYIYNLNSSSSSGIRRWRCVDYRNNKCSAFVVTKGNLVLNRANLHNHPFHDKKIIAKIEKKAVYSAIDEVQGYKEKENSNDNDTSMEQDDYLLNFSGDNMPDLNDDKISRPLKK